MEQGVQEVEKNGLMATGQPVAGLPAAMPEVRYLKGVGESFPGKTIPGLLYEALKQYKNHDMFHRRHGDGWQVHSLEQFREHAEQIALGLLDLGLEKGDRVALYMESDTFFCMADMGCLIAGLIDVPIYLNQSPGTNEYILRHSGARALFVSSLTRLHDIDELLAEAPEIRTVIVAEPEEDQKLTPLPEGVQWLSMDTVLKRGARVLEAEPARISTMLEQLRPDDLASIVYTSGTTGEPKGVMLTHENLSCNALTSYNEMGDIKGGPKGEIVIEFLPLTHIFARTLWYGVLAYAMRIYFTKPEYLGEDLIRIRPTLFATVPRVLEKVYGRILEKITRITGFKKKLANWSLDVAGDFELGESSSGGQKLKLKVANTLVFRKWRAALGGRVKYIISGGAALNADLTNLFAAAGVNILQGYGLTETSPVISFNRPRNNRAGTIGQPLPDVEVKIAEDGEILTRGPHVMKGYYNNPEKTSEAIDEAGWFHTGDVGEIVDGEFLRITDRKKDLFKLSTGKYVMPQPLENRLGSHPLIEQAVVVGPGQKYCTALLFVDHETLKVFAESRGLNRDIPMERLIAHPKIIQRYQELVDAANAGMDHWSTIKQFCLLQDHLTIENGMLTPTLKIKRSKVLERYKNEIDELYHKNADSNISH